MDCNAAGETGLSSAVSSAMTARRMTWAMRTIRLPYAPLTSTNSLPSSQRAVRRLDGEGPAPLHRHANVARFGIREGNQTIAHARGHCDERIVARTPVAGWSNRMCRSGFYRWSLSWAVWLSASGTRTSPRSVPEKQEQLIQCERIAGGDDDGRSARSAIRFHGQLPGAWSLFRCAADYRIWVPDPQRMYPVNVEARATLLAALEAGVRRVVYTSSVATLATAPPIDPQGRARSAKRRT